MLGQTYLLKRIISLIDRCKSEFPDVNVKIVKVKNVDDEFLYSGCTLNFIDTKYALSLQTSSLVTMGSFCESALISKADGVVYEEELGYDDVIRHADEEKM